ncbi:MAG: LemA family protein [Rikenella sp.]|nr:LemA family protein [Rikenella sp.]
MSLVVVILLFVIWPISVYNGLVRRRNEIQNAFGTIDVVLKQRFDLLPNLAEAVKGYAEHEATTLIQVTAMRGGRRYDDMSTVEKHDFANRSLLGIRDFYVAGERYPDLKASTHFMHLQRTLNEQEEQIAAARRTYNAMVAEFNTIQETFPSSIVASLFHFERGLILDIPEEERAVPSLKNIFGAN